MISSKASDERRRHPRAITNFSAVLTTQTANSYSTRIINLSLGGALLHLWRVVPSPPIVTGDRLSLDIRCRGSERPLLLDGRVVLSNLAGSDQPLLAVQFDEVAGENAEILDDLITEALAELRGRAALPPPARRRAPPP